MVLFSWNLRFSFCVCTIHQNTNLLLCAAKVHKNCHELIELMVCDRSCCECMIHRCSDCPGVDALSTYLLRELVSDPDDSENSDNGATVTDTRTEPVLDFVELLITQLYQLTSHSYLATAQANNVLVKISEFVAYFPWIGVVTDKDKENQDVYVNIFHPHFPSHSFHWPTNDDVCWVPRHVICTLSSLKTITGKQYNLSLIENQQLGSLWEHFVTVRRYII